MQRHGLQPFASESEVSATSPSVILKVPRQAVISMVQAVPASERRETAGVMKCKACRGDVFSVADFADDTPITCDRCGGIVGRWADVRALTNIPEKGELERTQGDVFATTYRGVAELSLVGID